MHGRINMLFIRSRYPKLNVFVDRMRQGPLRVILNTKRCVCKEHICVCVCKERMHVLAECAGSRVC